MLLLTLARVAGHGKRDVGVMGCIIFILVCYVEAQGVVGDDLGRWHLLMWLLMMPWMEVRTTRRAGKRDRGKAWKRRQ